jgi:hypothetical protein
MKKTIWFILLSLFVWSGTAQFGWGAQEKDNPFPPVLPNPPELPSTEKQEKQEGENDGPIVIDLTRPAAETPNQAQEQLSELRPNQAEDLTPPQREPDQDQKILVREKFAGWNEAGTGTEAGKDADAGQGDDADEVVNGVSAGAEAGQGAEDGEDADAGQGSDADEGVEDVSASAKAVQALDAGKDADAGQDTDAHDGVEGVSAGARAG